MAEINKLTDLKVKSLKTPGRYSDGGNLYLQITSTDARSWLFVYRFDGKQKEMGLGPFTALGLADARKMAAKARIDLAAGQDPLEVRREQQRLAALARAKPTFGEWVETYLEGHKADWKNAKHRAQWRSTLTQYAKPLWKMQVDKIETRHVQKVLEPIWEKVPETASRLRGRIERVLSAATSKGDRQGPNPARWNDNLKDLLAKREREVRHHPAMAFEAMPDFMAQLRSRDSVSALALEMLILCAARSGEVRGMTWGEIDLAKRLWTIPGSRMKAGKPHTVPLTDRAIAILETVKGLSGFDASDTNAKGRSDEIVFRAPKGGPLSDMALAMQLRRMGHNTITAHGFRSTFRDWAGEVTSFPREIAEAALAHRVGDATERAYRRGDALEKRRLMMTAWEGFIEPKTPGSNVLQIGKGRASL